MIPTIQIRRTVYPILLSKSHSQVSIDAWMAMKKITTLLLIHMLPFGGMNKIDGFIKETGIIR